MIAEFVPFPFATENHQEYNAKVLENVEAAKIILDRNLNKETLERTLFEMLEDKEKLLKMGQNAGKVSIKDVEEKIYEEIASPEFRLYEEMIMCPESEITPHTSDFAVVA